MGRWSAYPLCRLSRCRLGPGLLACAALATTAGAAPLPASLDTRLQQGISACMDYYIAGTDIAELSGHGYAADGKGMSVKLTPPEVTRNVTVTTLVEGRGGAECEVHATYDRHETLKHAHALTAAVMAARGFTPNVRHHYNSKAKTIWSRGSLSVFNLYRVKRGRLMIKFKLRSR